MDRRGKEIKKIKYLIRKYNNKVPLNDIPINSYVKTDSWFDIKESKNFEFCNNLNFEKNTNNDKIIKCKKIILQPTKKQKKKLLEWLNSVRLIYNETIRIMRQRYYNKCKTITSFITLRSMLKEKKKSLIKIYDTPTHILDSGIKLACISYKSAFTNFRNGNIRHFNIRFTYNGY
jgi:hypothetical protein